MQVRRVESFAELWNAPGAYMVAEDGQPIVCLPCGHIWRNPPVTESYRWEVTNPESEATITVTPSIFCKGAVRADGSVGADCWHGFLTDGKLVSC